MVAITPENLVIGMAVFSLGYSIYMAYLNQKQAKAMNLLLSQNQILEAQLREMKDTNHMLRKIEEKLK